MTYVPEAMEDVRSYGPGKFSTVLDSLIYQLTLDTSWLDEESSNDLEASWAGIIRCPITWLDFRDAGILGQIDAEESLTDGELALLKATAGYLITEDSQGFVDITYYETLAELDADWQGWVDLDAALGTDGAS